MERFHAHAERGRLGPVLAAVLLVATAAAGAAEPVAFELSAADAPEASVAWDRLAGDGNVLVVDVREIRNLLSGYLTIHASLACPGAKPLWTASLTPFPRDEPGRYLFELPRAALADCAPRLRLRLDAAAAQTAAGEPSVTVRGTLQRSR